MDKNVLSLTYLGNIQYFTKLCFEPCVIDVHEHFQSQSYRNRCEILTANGVTALTVNTVKSDNWSKATVKETRIDYSKRWQHRHWQSLVSSYRNSPYFEFYADRFEPILNKRYEFLMDYNLELMALTLELLGLEPAKFINTSKEYVEVAEVAEVDVVYNDLRDSLSPKPRLLQPDPTFHPAPYWQVFSDRMAFAPNLSIVDLLFCEGTNALKILDASHLYLD